MISRLVFPVAVFFAALCASAGAQGKDRIDRAADLPRFNYAVSGKVEDMLRDGARFKPFADAVRRDVESVLAKYDIADKTTERTLLAELAQLDVLDGRYDAALARLDRIKALEDKPSDKLLSGVVTRGVIAGVKARTEGRPTSADADAVVAQTIRSELAPLPFEVIANAVREMKASAELLGEGRLIGSVREVLQPGVDKNGALSSDLAPDLIRARYVLIDVLPFKPALVGVWTDYLAAHTVDKPDIWAARSIALPPGRGYAPVNIGIWDSGVDTSLFPGQVAQSGGKVPVLAFDRYANPDNGELAQIPADLKSKLAQLKSRLKGFSDLQSNIDSPEAAEVKRFLSALKPEEYKPVVEEIELVSNWMHGTHVAGIAVAGNPYARLVVGRIEYDWHLIPDPCPSRELTLRDARNQQAYIDFFKRNHVRVVNMSWGGNVKDVEHALELCNIGKTPDERKALAREYFDIQKNALIKAFRSAPDILFITSAGNSNEDASFIEDIPADIVLPNLLAVGAVDKAGDEASFTSYGPTVAVHANGYQVESFMPGGEKLAESGTSMASPQVTNLAAKMLAVNPSLEPPQLIALIRGTADKSGDGRRTLINPKKAVAAATSARTRA